MKLKTLISSCIILIYVNVHCQEKLNVLVTVDDVITGPYNLTDSYLIIGKDSINLKYEMGRFELVNTEILKSFNSNNEVSLNFRYYSSCPKQKSYYYKINLKTSLLLQDYLLLKIYNFEMYPNVFKTNIGYGFEYISPIVSEVLPTKKKIKRKKCK
jgi:hypothetical protein